jgi:hypothetical protein
MINYQIWWNCEKILDFFHKKVVLIRTILLITKSHSQGLERSIGDVGERNRTLFDVFDNVLTLQMRVCQFGNVM